MSKLHECVSGRLGLLLSSLSIAILCGQVLLVTSPQLPMAWDEGSAIWGAAGISHWAERWAQDPKNQSPGPLSQEAIAHDWRYTTQIEGHPAFYGIVIALGQAASLGRLGPLDSHRFGPMMLFALAAGALFYRMRRDYTESAAIGAVVALMLMPRMFAHAHFASFDGPLTSCWILAWATFASARERWFGTICFGIALGMTLSSKATGWLAPVPFLAWTLVYRDRAAVKALAVGIPLAILTFYLLNPPLWHDPIGGWIKFAEMNFSRREFNISTQFLGRMYNLDHPLPWYNTIVWSAITIPLGILLLTGIGMVTVLSRWRSHPGGVLIAANALVLLVVRALPGVPPHDGVRLFLPCFAFLAALAGVGCGRMLDWHRPPSILRWTAVLAIYLASGVSLWWYSPQWLSYYNLAIGGLPGATAAGMEPTYYWDGLDRSVLDWLKQHTKPDEKVQFGSPSIENLLLMKRWNTLPIEFRADRPGEYRWYVIQHRPSGWQPADRWLLENAEPVFVRTIRSGGWGPWRLTVPLVSVYDHQEYVRAREAIRERSAARFNGL